MFSPRWGTDVAICPCLSWLLELMMPATCVIVLDPGDSAGAEGPSRCLEPTSLAQDIYRYVVLTDELILVKSLSPTTYPDRPHSISHEERRCDGPMNCD